VSRTVDTRAPMRPSWPDVDINGVIADVGIGGLRDVRALALGYETDWDLVRVWWTGGADPELLGPGRLLYVGRGQEVARIEPVIPAPATRLYDASMYRQGVVAPTAAVPLNAPYPNGAASINYTGTGTINLYKWTGTTWGPATAVGPGPLPGVSQNGAMTDRPADYSIDQTWTLADLIIAGLILHPDGARISGTQIASQFAYDAHGNAGDTRMPGLNPYLSNRFGDLSPLFYGRLAIDGWWDECPSPDYQPRLAPQRFIRFGSIAVAAGAASPDQPLLTVPVINAQQAQFTFTNSGAGNVFAHFRSPLGIDGVTGINGIIEADPTGGASQQWGIFSSGTEGALVLDEINAPFLKVVLGADGGGATIPAGATLAITRTVDQ
jgi:hypothetical protein